MRVLITGHQGFIGSWACCQFKSQGWQVYGIDDRSSFGVRLYDVAHVDQLVDDQLICDVADYELTKNYISNIKPELVVHLAGQAIVPRAFREPHRTFKTNALGTVSVIQSAADVSSTKAIVCITSDKVYDNPGTSHPFTEADVLGGSDIYSVSKSSCEYIARAYAKTHLATRDLNVQTIRLGNVVGGGDWSINRLVPDLINASIADKPFLIRYADATRPFQHVTDVTNGILSISSAALNNTIPTGSAWNLGPLSNSYASVRDVINIFLEYFPGLIIQEDPHRVKEDIHLRVNVDKYSSQFNPPRDTSLAALHRAFKWYKDFYYATNAFDLIHKELY